MIIIQCFSGIYFSGKKQKRNVNRHRSKNGRVKSEYLERKNSMKSRFYYELYSQKFASLGFLFYLRPRSAPGVRYDILYFVHRSLDLLSRIQITWDFGLILFRVWFWRVLHLFLKLEINWLLIWFTREFYDLLWGLGKFILFTRNKASWIGQQLILLSFFRSSKKW